MIASLQNSVPVQATAPRQKLVASTWRPIWPSSRDKFAGLGIGNIDEEQILRDGGAQFATAETFGEFGGGFQLFAGEAAAQDGGADVAQARLALRMNAGVIAEDVAGHGFFARWEQT